MIKSAAALKARIKNKAGGNSDKSQILLRIYMMERLLERVSVSEYRGSFILKGGLLVSSLVGVDMRSTMDVDTSVTSFTLNEENAKRILEEIMAIDLEDGVKFYITKSQDIMEGHEYEGIRFMIECHLDRLVQTIKIDLSTGDEITPGAVEYKLPLIVEDRSIDLLAYNLETLLAEKLQTIMVRAEANTRMRDFYDIHILLKYEGDRVDRDTLAEAFRATCRRRMTEDKLFGLRDVIASVRGTEVMKVQWVNYLKNNYYTDGLSWDDALESVWKLADWVR